MIRQRGLNYTSYMQINSLWQFFKRNILAIIFLSHDTHKGVLIQFLIYLRFVDLSTWKYTDLDSFSREKIWELSFCHMTPSRGSNYSFQYILAAKTYRFGNIPTWIVFQGKYVGNYILSHHTLNGIKLQFLVVGFFSITKWLPSKNSYW